MSKANLTGVIFAVLSLIGFTYFMVGGTHFSIQQWPVEAYQGLVFSIVWGMGVSPTIGHVYSALIVLTLVIVSFAIGHKMARLLSNNNSIKKNS
ncbi:hypothetical protein [Vibrio maerlii]|uniref:hypothetical protein n=1 Tax=Vibrio maerlii TaxID=2231648 RepID=UPI000E3E7DD3|nr:hypothetical protein [Vibrio maerlii]